MALEPRLGWTASTALRNDLDADKVRLVHENCVLAYLDAHLDLVEPLSRLCQRARQEFGPEADLELSWQQGETGPEADFLWLRLRLPVYDDTVGKRITDVAAASDLGGRLSGRILFTTDFCPALNEPDQCKARLSARDAAQVLADLENPPPPNEAALQAAKWFTDNYG